MNISSHDIDIMARTINGEAEGEPYEGKLCVGWTIYNRANAKYRGDGIARVCQWPSQYSCWNSTDPTYKRITRVDLSDRYFRECYRAALEVVSGTSIDITGGATHYHTISKPKWAKKWPPSWAVNEHPCSEVGGHVFYKGIP